MPANMSTTIGLKVELQKGISPIIHYVGIWYHLAWKRCLEDTRWLLWSLMRGLRFRWLFGQIRNAIIPRRMAELRNNLQKSQKRLWEKLDSLLALLRILRLWCSMLNVAWQQFDDIYCTLLVLIDFCPV